MGKASKDGDETKPKKNKKVLKKKSAKKEAPPRKPPPRKSGILKQMMFFIAAGLLVAGITKIVESTLDKSEEKNITKQYGILISAMDKLFFGCTVWWSGEGRGEACTEEVWKRVSGPRFDEITVTILKGQKYEFLAKAEHNLTNKASQIDRKGDVFLNFDGCLIKVDFHDLTLENIRGLEQQCKPDTPPPAK